MTGIVGSVVSEANQVSKQVGCQIGDLAPPTVGRESPVVVPVDELVAR